MRPSALLHVLVTLPFDDQLMCVSHYLLLCSDTHTALLSACWLVASVLMVVQHAEDNRHGVCVLCVPVHLLSGTFNYAAPLNCKNPAHKHILSLSYCLWLLVQTCSAMKTGSAIAA